MEAFVWITLWILGFCAIHGVVERVLHVITVKPAEDSALLEFIRVCETGRDALIDVQCQRALGWLRKSLNREIDENNLIHECALQRRRVTRTYGMLNAVANTSPAVGLLGSVLAMINATGNGNSNCIVSLGMESTMWGLIIAIPTGLFVQLMEGRVNTMLDQVGAVEDAVNDGCRNQKDEVKYG